MVRAWLLGTREGWHYAGGFWKTEEMREGVVFVQGFKLDRPSEVVADAANAETEEEARRWAEAWVERRTIGGPGGA